MALLAMRKIVRDRQYYAGVHFLRQKIFEKATVKQRFDLLTYVVILTLFGGAGEFHLRQEFSAEAP